MNEACAARTTVARSYPFAGRSIGGEKITTCAGHTSEGAIKLCNLSETILWRTLLRLGVGLDEGGGGEDGGRWSVSRRRRMDRRRAARGRAGGRLLNKKMADVIQHARNAWPSSATTASIHSRPFFGPSPQPLVHHPLAGLTLTSLTSDCNASTVCKSYHQWRTGDIRGNGGTTTTGSGQEARSCEEEVSSDSSS